MNKGSKKLPVALALFTVAAVCAALLGVYSGRTRGISDGLAQGDAMGYDAGQGAGMNEGNRLGSERAEAYAGRVATEMLDKDGEKYPMDASQGNTYGNLGNRGYAVEGGGYVYYCLDGDVYRMSADGAETKLHCSHYSANGLLYYDGSLYHARSGTGIWRSPAEGGECTKISDAPADEMFGFFDDKLYFRSSDDTKLSNLDLNTMEWETVCDLAFIYYINITDDEMFFTMGDDMRFLYKSGLDGSNLELLFENNCHWVNIVGDSVFFTVYEKDKNKENKYYRMNLDGSGITTVYVGTVGGANVTPYGVFFSNGLRKCELCLLSLDGKTVAYFGRTSNYINVAGGWVFYDSDGKLYRVRVDGSDEVCLSDGFL